MILPKAATGTPSINPAVAPRARAMPPGFVIEIGEAVIPVYGDASTGWSIDEHDIAARTPYRYATLDELVFAVLNFCILARGAT